MDNSRLFANTNKHQQVHSTCYSFSYCSNHSIYINMVWVCNFSPLEANLLTNTGKYLIPIGRCV